MGLGSTAKKIQGLSDRAEAMYKQVQQLQQRIVGLEEEMDDTHDTVKRLDHQLSEQRALLLAIAEKHDIDGEEILAEAAIDEAELDGDDEAADESPIEDAERDAGESAAE
ncbi:DUF5798 family protein [Natrarchaeobius oligotrophus]|uniref:Chromosome segregation protein SMC n=1 Tax=Natrarchaeobius chitinivorans TaxID=1679083 RepID=A0A3N6PTX8_NATCH|nr:DUF5798 family protein [Natrarchaeobius chitinivorans]RQH03166.1 hypothetical protein EA472_00810 [Natrarchaeobius chitinivorans]